MKTGQLVKNITDTRNSIGFRNDNRYRCISLCANVLSRLPAQKSDSGLFSLTRNNYKILNACKQHMNKLFNFFFSEQQKFFRHKATFYNSKKEKLCCKDATDVQVKV